jgi:hypothetical protein
MAENKYGKYIIDNFNGRPVSDVRDDDEFQKALPDMAHLIAYLDSNMLKGGFYTEVMWYHKATPARVEPHTHDFNEVLAFIGGNPDDYTNLNGEIELWLGDEKHTLTKSCMVFIPKGLKHCPMVVKRVDRPILHFSLGPGAVYDKKEKK